jgi:1-acyl-sn-glycerol-3-phosphate acyltransferase
LVFLFLKLFFKLKVKGREALPKDQPFILASNHISNLDPAALAAVCPRKIGFLAKKELFKNRISNWYIKTVGGIPLRRGISDVSAVRETLKILRLKPLLVFPQGTRGADFDKANPGVGFLYKKAKAPIIAAKIYGTDKVLPKGAKFFKKGRIEIKFARVDNIKDSDSYEEITAKVMAKIKSL